MTLIYLKPGETKDLGETDALIGEIGHTLADSEFDQYEDLLTLGDPQAIPTEVDCAAYRSAVAKQAARLLATPLKDDLSKEAVGLLETLAALPHMTKAEAEAECGFPILDSEWEAGLRAEAGELEELAPDDDDEGA